MKKVSVITLFLVIMLFPATALLETASAMGDINGDGRVSLQDVIMALQLQSGVKPSDNVRSAADVNKDSRLGMVEAIYGLQIVAGLRHRVISYPERATVSIDMPAGIRVNAFTGNLVVSRTLLDIPGRGLPVHFELTYNSDRRLVMSPLGPGWSLSYDISYTRDSSGNAYILWGDGRLDAYTATAGGFTAPPGLYMTLTEPLAGRLLLKTKHGIEYHFADSTHQKVTSLSDPNGNSLTFTYDSTGRVTTVTDAGGRTYEMTYNANGRMDKLTDRQLTRTYTFTYDVSGRVASIADPLGKAETFGYDAANAMTALTDKLGQTATVTYTTPPWDADTRLPQSVAKGGSTFTLGFDVVNKRTTLTGPLGGGWKYEYDNLGRVTSVTDPIGNATTFAWDANRNLTSRTDALSNTTTYTYDSQGNVLSVTDALGNGTTFTYEPAFNREASKTDALGATWSHTYDSKGNRLNTQDPMANIILRTYDAEGRVISYTERTGNTTNYAYDTNGNVTRVTDPLGNQTQFEYDGAGRVVRRTDANGNATTYVYDSLDRLTQVTDALGVAEDITYDAKGRVTAYTDRTRTTTTYSYDALDRLVNVTDALGNADTRTYDANGRITSYQDRRGNSWTNTYDAVNRRLSSSDPLGNTITYTYDAVGKLLSRTDAKEQVTTFTYDAVNRLTGQTFGDGAIAAYTYDGKGRLRTAVDDFSSEEYFYDAQGRVVRYTDRLLGKSVLYEYDNEGRVTEKTGPEGDVATYTYDAGGRVTALTDGTGGITRYTYDAAGNRLTETRPNNVASTYTYDADGRVASIVHKDPMSVVLQSFAYTYDAGGRVAATTRQNGDVHTYTYDALGRPTREDVTSTSNPATTVELEYDANGNRTRLVFTLGFPITTTFTYNAVNRALTKAQGSATTTYTYDANGNRTNEYGPYYDLVYSFDARDRIKEVNHSLLGSRAYTYDTQDRLIMASGSAVSSMPRRIMYDGDHPIAEDSNGDGTLDSRYTQQPPSSGATAKWSSSFFQDDNSGPYTFFSVANTGSGPQKVTLRFFDKQGTETRAAVHSVTAGGNTWQLHAGSNFQTTATVNGFQVYGVDLAPEYGTPALITTSAGADGGHRTTNIDDGPDSFDTAPSSVADHRLGETPGTLRDPDDLRIGPGAVANDPTTGQALNPEVVTLGFNERVDPITGEIILLHVSGGGLANVIVEQRTGRFVPPGAVVRPYGTLSEETRREMELYEHVEGRGVYPPHLYRTSTWMTGPGGQYETTQIVPR